MNTFIGASLILCAVVIAGLSMRRSLRDRRVLEQQALNRAYHRHGGRP